MVTFVTIYFKSDLEVVVDLRPILPMEGVSLILGNDLVGERVIPDLQVVIEQEVIKEVMGMWKPPYTFFQLAL